MITGSTIEVQRCLKTALLLLIRLDKMSPGTACVIRAALVLHNKCVLEGYEVGDAAHNPQDVLEHKSATIVGGRSRISRTNRK